MPGDLVFDKIQSPGTECAQVPLLWIVLQVHLQVTPGVHIYPWYECRAAYYSNHNTLINLFVMEARKNQDTGQMSRYLFICLALSFFYLFLTHAYSSGHMPMPPTIFDIAYSILVYV